MTIHPNIQGILWTLLATFVGANSAACIRVIGQHYSPFQVVCLSYLSMLLWMTPWFFLRGAKQVRTKVLKWYSFRAMLEVTGFCLVVVAIGILPLSMYAAMTFVTPIL